MRGGYGGLFVGGFGMVAAEFHLSKNTQRRITETVQTEHRQFCSLFLHVASFIHDTGLYSIKLGLFKIQIACSLVSLGQRQTLSFAVRSAYVVTA